VTDSSNLCALVLHFDALAVRFLGCYGNEWVATPAIDRLAHESVVFDHCFSPLDLLGSGAREGAFDLALAAYRAGQVRVGWGTCSIRAIPPRDVEILAPARGESHGLGRLLASAGDWIEQGNGGPQLLWLDLGMAPAEWAPSADLIDEYLDGKSPFDLRGESSGVVEESISLEQLDSLRDTYAARIAELDRHLGMLLDRLRGSGRWPETLVVLSADQGFPLGEHDVVGLATPWLHNERDHVPLIVKWPGALDGSRSPSLVSPADIGPTLAAGLGVCTDPVPDAMSLVPIFTGEPARPREYLVSGLSDREYAIRTTPWKLILPVGSSPDRPRQLYAKPEDLFEINEVSHHRLDVADHLELQLWRYLDARRRGTLDSLPPLRKDLLLGLT
jgi:hypothetical protein